MTTYHNKLKERLNLVAYIETNGIEMKRCSLCVKEQRKCVLAKERSGRCSECVRAKCSCDAEFPLGDAWEREVPSMGDWESIARQKARLEEQEEEAMAKILRLRKQRRLLTAREAEMASRGLKFLDELDAVEEREKREAEERESASAPVVSTSSVLDFAELDSPEFWANLGVAGGTPQEVPSGSQGSS